MSTWEERMAHRARDRQIAGEAAEGAREAEEYLRAATENPPLEGEFGPLDYEPHRGHWQHVHPAHIGFVVCQCGERMGVYSYVPGGTPPEPCPVCAARGIAPPGEG